MPAKVNGDAEAQQKQNQSAAPYQQSQPPPEAMAALRAPFPYPYLGPVYPQPWPVYPGYPAPIVPQSPENYGARGYWNPWQQPGHPPPFNPFPDVQAATRGAAPLTRDDFGSANPATPNLPNSDPAFSNGLSAGDRDILKRVSAQLLDLAKDAASEDEDVARPARLVSGLLIAYAIGILESRGELQPGAFIHSLESPQKLAPPVGIKDIAERLQQIADGAPTRILIVVALTAAEAVAVVGGVAAVGYIAYKLIKS